MNLDPSIMMPDHTEVSDNRYLANNGHLAETSGQHPNTDLATLHGGGLARPKMFSWSELAKYTPFEGDNIPVLDVPIYELLKYTTVNAVDELKIDNPGAFTLAVPLSALLKGMTVLELQSLARLHGIYVARQDNREALTRKMEAHVCVTVECESYTAVFIPSRASQELLSMTYRDEYMAKVAAALKPFSLEELTSFATVPALLFDKYRSGARFAGLQEVDGSTQLRNHEVDDDHSFICYPVLWMILADKGTKSVVHYFAKLHGIPLAAKATRLEAMEFLGAHACMGCKDFRAVFKPVEEKKSSRTKATQAEPQSESTDEHEENEHSEGLQGQWFCIDPPEEDVHLYPPVPLSEHASAEIVREFCGDLKPTKFEEAGCMVCGQLTLLTESIPMSEVVCSLNPLIENGIVRRPRTSASQRLVFEPGPVLDFGCEFVCNGCHRTLKNGKRPRNALANGLWLGPVPPELKHLTYAEQCLIARVRSNRCVVRVSMGQAKMMADAVSFACPTLKVYQRLPPTREELDEVLAFIFTGVQPPNEDDLERTPMLVRRNKVGRALEWLKVNHVDYHDLNINYDSLSEYPMSGIPVEVMFRRTVEDTNVIAATTSQHDSNEDEGASDGICPLKVNGLVGENLEAMSFDARKAAAVNHLQSGGHVLAVGHSEHPESMYDNPQLYPQMYPWLFPYGVGGIGNARLSGLMSESRQKKWMLLYHDKRFQLDSRFILVSFNHEQIKTGVRASYILTKRRNFSSLANEVSKVSPAVVHGITNRLLEGEKVIPETEEERRCFQLMDQIEHVGVSVPGTMAGRKRMRTNLWSMMTCKGSPSWFITLSPVDINHPICLYWADRDVQFKPDLRVKNEHVRLIAHNPVAGARFFHYMVRLFIKHLLRWGDEEGRRGIFGHTSGYFGTVEQQGRMTLHLHMLVWVACSLSPNEIRERLLSGDSDFMKELIAYLENAHIGEFLTGTMLEMDAKYGSKRPRGYGRRGNEIDSNDPTQHLPIPPPEVSCQSRGNFCPCASCVSQREWRARFRAHVDHLIYVSNKHECKRTREVTVGGSGTYNVKSIGKGCLNKDGICSARFPREVHERSTVDDKGRLSLKKLEPRINTVNGTMVYCYGCNTDCTCLTSGTAVNATVGYVADYIVKMGLKTHQIFSLIYDVFEKNVDIWTTSPSRGDAARKLILKMANSLTSKMEIGAPMAAMYLLELPDNLCSHSFVPLYWKQFHTDVTSIWESVGSCDEDIAMLTPVVSASFEGALHINDPSEADVGFEGDGSSTQHDIVSVVRSGSRLISRSSVDDYKMRPTELAGVCVYEWIQCGWRVRLKGMGKEEKCLLYEDGHPLRETHGVTYNANRILTVIPSILGPSLPRRDAEDREYYSCAMLSLFAPWRSGFDLKSSDETWVQAFERYTFSPRHHALMLNMNLRYECYDARDDYRAQMKQRASALREEMDEEEDFLEEDIGEYNETSIPESLMDDALLGEWSKWKKGQMSEVEAVLQSAGWVADISLPSRKETLKSFCPERSLAPTKWKQLVSEERTRVLGNRRKGIPSNRYLEDDMDVEAGVINDARIVPGSYLSAEFKVRDVELEQLRREVITHFKLNKEQTRAFSIVANHSMSIRPAPLMMYVGGMGGTGKTTVIKLLRRWFMGKGQPYRMVVLAPTGAAASIVDGSTYHSFLGVRTGDRKLPGAQGSGALEDARTRMQGVDYIFLDEISMVSCQDLFIIDSRLKDISKVYDIPFGGLNIIVAGDFAQLPPAKGLAIYSGEVSRFQAARQTKSDQENTLGLLIWHQFTTVVMLTQNMRQTLDDHPDESQLRETLIHMRYKDCTPKDIAFLRSRIPAFNSQLSLENSNWKDVSVITAWNTHKDQINAMNATRFALEHGEVLHYFYSIDKQTQTTGKRRGRKSVQNPEIQPMRLTPAVQEALWNSPPYTSDHIAGCLAICRGMPVMIRHNEATELSMTKGQEAIIRGWTSHELATRSGRSVLDTLFVELILPSPKEVQLPFLPKNVVPLTRVSVSLLAILPNDRMINITRQQVPILLNFAMTDYASQGKTRSVNVIDMKHCRNHQAMYTALSRGTSARNTLIVREFSTKKITGGLSGYLRQEFRDLETLDEINIARYEGTLPVGIVQRLRDSTLRAYRAYKVQGLSLEDSQSVGMKRKRAVSEPEPGPALKQIKVKAKHETITRDLPTSTWEWDGVDWSCAYDAYLTILFCLWTEDPTYWTNALRWYGMPMSSFINEILKYKMGVVHMDSVRERVRREMRELSEEDFPRGRVGTDLYTLVRAMNGYGHVHPLQTMNRMCENCGSENLGNPLQHIGRYVLMCREDSIRHLSIAEYMAGLEQPVATCEKCSSAVLLTNSYPPMLSIQLPQQVDTADLPRISLSLQFQHARYSLVGVVYWSALNFHFASRVLNSSGCVLKYDGMIMQGALVPDTSLDTASFAVETTMRSMDHRSASLVVYARDVRP